MQLDRWLQSSKDDITRPQPQPGWLSIRFLGNASVQMARERRKRAIAEMNNKLIELVEKDSRMPHRYSSVISLPRRQRNELRCLDRAAGRGRHQNFYNHRPPAQRRGGGTSSSHQGYTQGRGRFYPYHKFGNFRQRGRSRGQ